MNGSQEREGAERDSVVSLIIPALNEEANAPGVVGRIVDIARDNPSCAFEVVIVDDGSTDRTAEVFCAELQRAGLNGVVISLSRNFGSHGAVSAGVHHAHGDVAITLSGDLQEPPSLVGQMLDAHRAGADVVWAVRGVRVDAGGAESNAARGFSRILATHSEIPNYPAAGPSQVLLSRPVIDALAALPEGNRNVLGLVAWLGFPQATVAFQQESRAHGASRWNNRKRIKLVVDSFVAHSRAPLVAMGAVGAAVLAVALLLGIAALVAAVMGASTLGWGLAAGFAAVVGTQIVAVTALSTYVWRAGYDARRRPVFVIRAVQRTNHPLPSARAEREEPN